MNRSAAEVEEVPPGVVTVTSWVPVPAGAVAVIVEAAELNVNDAAGADPNMTEDALASPLPLIVTVVPPITGPALGLTPVTVGTGS